jgi:hypothetical protein
MSENVLEQAIEWEASSKPLVLDHVEFPVPPFMPGVSKVTITRDDNLHLQLVAEGQLTDAAEFARRQRQEDAMPLGTFSPMTEISFDALGGRLDLRMHIEHAPSELRTTMRETRVTQRGSVYRVRRTCSHRLVVGDGGQSPHAEPLMAPAWMSDWYINGATTVRFTHVTTRRRSTSYARERKLQTAAVVEDGGRGGAWDHIVVDTPDVRFALCDVPDEHAPDDLHAVSLDFMPPFPDLETRTAIGEIVSFVLGRRMMRVGSTSFDASGWSIEEESVNPWGANIRELCRGTDLPPVPYHYEGKALESLLADLVPRYLAAREPLGLKDALWSYWIAKEAPASIDLPIFASAVEALKKSWLSSTRSKSKGLHLSKEDFETLAGDLVAELRKRLAEKGGPEEVARTVAGANRMGLSEQMRTFLDEINVWLGPNEKAAMDARHRSAHGAGGGKELEALVRAGNAYRTLFDRVFLRLLGYKGRYVDRTTVGHPMRDLAEPAGGA